MYRIYYDDGTSFELHDAPPTGDRSRGVVVILQSDPDVGWQMQSGTDYYVWRDARWWGVDIFGLFDFLMDSGIVLFGRMISTEEYRDILAQAKADKTLARKRGSLPARYKERRA